MSKNKRIIAIFLSLMMLISSGIFVNNAHAAQAKPTVYAHSYTVMDANSGEIIISEQENKRIYPASTIKLLTAIVAIENCSLYKRITVKKSTLSKVDVETTTAGLKPGYAYTLEELLMSAEYIMAGGNENVILCERGIRTFENAYRNTLDISAVPMLKTMTHLPVVIDPSHAAGLRFMVEPLAMSAIAAGADGLMIEVHNNPEKALCDGPQSLTPAQFDDLMGKVRMLQPVCAKFYQQ